jgi:peptidoglycan hydrolase CwlO-like protein
MEAQSRLADSERKIKSLDADRQLLQNEFDDLRDQLDLEMSKNQSLLSQYDKLKAELEKKLADKEEELSAQRLVELFFCFFRFYFV